MAGTFPGFSGSQVVDQNGRPSVGASLYVFSGGTLSLASVYQDIGLTTVAQNPLVSDAYGRLPLVYVADGTYRCRLISSTGVQIFDYPQVPSIGASSSGGGGAPVDITTIFQTGWPLWLPIAGVTAGFVRANGRTIGSATSGASERANSDCSSLFSFLWTNFADAICAVSTGRGASAAADFAANKSIGLLDLRAKGVFGLADMGNASVTEFDGLTFARGDKTTAASLLGAGKKILASTELPVITPAGTIAIADPGHVHVDNLNPFKNGGPYSIGAGGPPTSRSIDTGAQLSWNTASGVTGISGTFTGTPFGGGQAFDKMSPGMLGTWYLKL